jgi:hypothetical protein
VDRFLFRVVIVSRFVKKITNFTVRSLRAVPKWFGIENASYRLLVWKPSAKENKNIADLAWRETLAFQL